MELLKTNNSAIYDTSFFDEINRPAIRSARPIAALVYNLLQPKRVVDVGCGLGAWLLAFKDLGACEVRGLDGEHVDPDRLLIDRNCFEPIDLARPFVVGGQYDLAISLEVAEHLPRAAVPNITLKSPKFSRHLTTEWYANRTENRYETCMARAQ